jgi:hypothetical protein
MATQRRQFKLLFFITLCMLLWQIPLPGRITIHAPGWAIAVAANVNAVRAQAIRPLVFVFAAGIYAPLVFKQFSVNAGARFYTGGKGFCFRAAFNFHACGAGGLGKVGKQRAKAVLGRRFKSLFKLWIFAANRPQKSRFPGSFGACKVEFWRL